MKVLFGLTLAFFLVAVAQTLFLRRRTPAVTTGARTAPGSRPTASRGVQVLDGEGTGARKAGASAKAPLPPRSNRSPKARGGPKGGGQKAGGPQKNRTKTPARPRTLASEAAAPVDVPDVTEVAQVPDDGGPPTVAAPPPPAPVPRAKRHEPAIAQLLEEDLWAPEPEQEDGGEPPAAVAEATDGEPAAVAGEPAPVAAAPPAPPAPEWAPFDTGSTPAIGGPPPGEPALPIPPVPAEELSFWDLFPEDLPPARAAAFPAEDLLVDPLALPEGPGSAAGRLVGEAGDAEPSGEAAADPPPAEPVMEMPTERPLRPPETEIVIAELLDGPLPTGLRQPADAAWAPQAPGDDFRVDDLLIDRSPPAANGDEDGDDEDDDDLAGATQGRSPEEQARVAADRARRRRSRRGGRRRPPGAG